MDHRLESQNYPYAVEVWTVLAMMNGFLEIQKSDNLQYNTLGRWVDGTMISLTKPEHIYSPTLWEQIYKFDVILYQLVRM